MHPTTKPGITFASKNWVKRVLPANFYRLEAAPPGAQPVSAEESEEERRQPPDVEPLEPNRARLAADEGIRPARVGHPLAVDDRRRRRTIRPDRVPLRERYKREQAVGRVVVQLVQGCD